MRPLHWFQVAFAIVTITFVTVLMLQTNDPIKMKIGKIGFVAGSQIGLLALSLSNRKTNAARLVAQKGITQ